MYLLVGVGRRTREWKAGIGRKRESGGGGGRKGRKRKEGEPTSDKKGEWK